MNANGKLIGPDTLAFERLFDARRDKVWQFLVDGDKRARWFCGGQTEPRVGGKIVFDFDHSRISSSPPPEKYAHEATACFEGEVLEWEPPTRLAFTWPEANGEGSKVEITLSEAEGGGTLLQLVHSGLTTPEYRAGALSGWHAHFNLLDDIFAGRETRDFWIEHSALEEHYAQ